MLAGKVSSALGRANASTRQHVFTFTSYTVPGHQVMSRSASSDGLRTIFSVANL